MPLRKCRSKFPRANGGTDRTQRFWKSTLLKIIAGVYKPNAGQVHVEGSLAPLIELGAGFHHELTGRENILLNGLLMGYSKEEMKEASNASSNSPGSASSSTPR